MSSKRRLPHARFWFSQNHRRHACLSNVRDFPLRAAAPHRLTAARFETSLLIMQG
jgi:hypothetical protein